MIISSRTLKEIKSKVRLVELASESMKLQRRGSSYVGLCPFHNEDTPSFHIKDDDNYYHCFGCGASGDPVTFVMRLNGYSFVEAVEYIANRYQIPIEYEGKKVNRSNTSSYEQKEKHFRLNQFALAFFRHSFQAAMTGNSAEDNAVKQYIAERELSEAQLEHFEIGYAPLYNNPLTSFFQRKKVPEDLMIASGLVKRSSGGELYDAYRGRLIFPIYVENKKIAGFGGRIIPALKREGTDPPKYINSPETAIYQKNKILYGLAPALQEIKKKKNLFIVEGYLDVISLWKAGIQNAVAPCGTALTENHVQRIKNVASSVYLFFDGDKAGRAAAARSFPLFLNSGVNARALFLPEGEDPDTIARKYKETGIAAFLQELNKDAQTLLQCYINELLTKQGLSNPTELGASLKAKIAADVGQHLTKAINPIERKELIKEAAFRLLVEEDLFEAMIHGEKVNSSKEVSLERGDEIKQFSELPALDRELLHIVMAKREEYINEVLKNPDLCGVLNPTTISFIDEFKRILLSIEDDTKRKQLVQDLLQSFGSGWVNCWKESYRMLSDKGVNFDMAYQGCLEQLDRLKKADLKKALEQQIKYCDVEEEKTYLLQKLIALNKSQ